MNKLFLTWGAALSALGVIAGAFGAHALKSKLGADQLQVFETAVKYQMIHALALIFSGILFEKIKSSGVKYAGYLFLGGIFLFSGSLYLLSTRELLGIESWTFLGPITPLGGLCFISGWIFLMISFINIKS